MLPSLTTSSSNDPRVILELSDSCGSSRTAAAVESGPAPAYPLQVSVQSFRTLVATLSVFLIIVGFVVVFTVFDIDLTSFNSVDKTDDQRKELLDYYNSISGSIANVVEKIIGVVLQAVIAIGMLSLATEMTLYDYRSWYCRYAAVVVVTTIGFLISSGLSALNVQIVPGRITIRMTAEDLVHTEPTKVASDDGILAMAWDKSTSEVTNGNPVLNTVFRSFILPFDASSDGICTKSEFAFAQPSVSFGYPSRSWHSRAALDVSGTQQAVQFNLNTDLDELKDESPPVSENVTRDLLGHGKRIAGDTWKYTPPNGTIQEPGIVDMTDVREIYSVTMGRLSWQVQDLSATYKAECTTSTCQGIRAIVNGSDSNSTHLILGETGIPLQLLKYSPVSIGWIGDFWKSLVQVHQYTMNAVLPRMFDHLNDDADKMKLLTGTECSQENEIVIDGVLKNHLYIEDSHQTACIAAFHFLFQNAIEHQQIEIGDTDAEPRLRFSGNDYQMAVRASIPIVSVVLSVLGCSVLLVIGVASVCYRNRSTSRIAEHTGPRTVAEAMINDTKFPSWLLHF